MLTQLSALASADAVLSYTPEDNYALSLYISEHVQLFESPTNHAIPLTGNEIIPSFGSRRGVVMVGFSHIINIESNLWFLTRVFPLVRRTLVALGRGDQAVASVIGMTKQEATRYAAQLGYNISDAQGEGIEWRGYVANLSQVFDEALVATTAVHSCPEFASKNMRPLARGIPVVTNPHGAQGYGLTDTSGTEGIVVVESGDAQEFAAVVARLLTEEDWWSQVSRGALNMMATRFQKEHVYASVQEPLRHFGASPLRHAE
mmetsp:Transcript_24870/g.58745  ORF Transcript_24870/g.58745 Transcript_24870/m.58745 type:complete len:260 (+) Transcript_24870:445-1224(+)